MNRWTASGTLFALLFCGIWGSAHGWQPLTAGGEPPEVLVYIPVADYSPSGEPVYPANFKQLASQIPILMPGARPELMPLRRAHFVYADCKGGCILDVQRQDGSGEVRSRALFSNRFWLYSAQASTVQALADVKRVGTIGGAELYLSKADLAAYEFSYAVNYTSLLTMLKNGRVDAITLSPYFFSEGGDVPLPLRRLGVRPILELAYLLRCKPTASTKQLIARVEEAWPPVRIDRPLVSQP